MNRRRRTSVLVIAAASMCLTGADWPGRERELAAEIAGAAAPRRIELLTQIAASTSPDAEATVVRALQDTDPSVRLAAAQLAGRHRYRAARDTLAAWLGDPLADVRAVAARSLGGLGDARSLPAIVRLLGDADVHVRLAAVDAIAAIGGPEATVPLLDRLADAESLVRVQTARALGDLGDPRAVLSLLGALQDSMPEVREATAVALGKLHDARAVSGLLGLLRDSQLDVRIAATRALGTLGSPDAVLDLAPLATSGDRPGDPARGSMATAAVDAIGRIGGATARQVLARVYLQSEGSLDLARAAADALRGMGADGRAAIPLLVARPAPTGLLAPSTREGAGLIDLLGDLGGDSAAEALIALYDGPDGSRHADRLLAALGRTGSRSALRVLLRAIGGNGAARESGGGAVSPDTARRGAVQGLSAYARTRGQLEPEALDPLIAAVQHPPRELSGDAARQFVAEIARLMGQTHNARATRVLSPMLGAREASLRAAAARALAVAGIAGAEGALADALGDAAPDVRIAAADALGRFGERAALDALVARWDAPRPLDRAQAARAIGRVGARAHDGRATELLRRALDRATPELTAAVFDALAALASSGDARAADVIRDSMRNDALALDSLGAAADAFDGAGDPARASLRDAVIERLAHDDEPARVATATWALSHADASVQSTLVARLQDPSPAVAANAAGALARLYGRGVHPDASARAGLCEHAILRRHPAVRANALLAAANAGWSCTRPDVLRRMLTDGRADFVRTAAVEALGVVLRTATNEDRALVRTELSQCAAVDRSAVVAARCRDVLARVGESSSAAPSASPSSASPAPTGDDPAGVDALITTDDEERIARRAPVALVARDGVVRMAWTGADGWLHDRPAPRGEYIVLDAENLGLEP